MKPIRQAHSSVCANSQNLFALGNAAIGYAACFDSALAITAQRMKKAMLGSTTSARLAIGRIGEGGYALGIDLHVNVRGLPRADARRLVQTTHRVCPYSNAILNNVDVRLRVSVARTRL
ncbi:MAG TPA: OsmC family protein [Steroidobacteraceae bacterium]|nr:OsmC family protein [Steroidobacteraceae bacterium]